jgi:hypothetical protein
MDEEALVEAKAHVVKPSGDPASARWVAFAAMPA